LGTIGGERFERRAGVVELAFTAERKRGVIAIQLVARPGSALRRAADRSSLVSLYL